MSRSAGSSCNSPPEAMDVNSPSFSPESYLKMLQKELNLHQLMDKEKDVFKGIQSLDSEMQTLVYENYNKFIVASDTICKMKEDFRLMESEMKRLAAKMQEITAVSSTVSTALKDRSAQVCRLSETKGMLQKLQFLFDLPKELAKHIANETFSEAIECYLKAKPVLDAYNNLDSFQGIRSDAMATIEDLERLIVEKFLQNEISPAQLKIYAGYLIRLGQDPASVASLFLEAVENGQLATSLGELETQLSEASSQGDSTEKVDPMNPFLPSLDSSCLQYQPFFELACTSLLSDVCITVACYNDVFIDPYKRTRSEVARSALSNLHAFVDKLMKRYLDCVEQRSLIEARESPKKSCHALIEALDRFHRRLQSLSQLVPGTDFGRLGTDLVLRVALTRCECVLWALQNDFKSKLRRAAAEASKMSKESGGSGSGNLGNLLSSIMKHVGENLKRVLEGLLDFVGPSVMFAGQPYFFQPYCASGVREGVIVQFFASVADDMMAEELMNDTSKCSPVVLLLLSRLCLELEKSTIHFFLTLLEEKFPLSNKTHQTSHADLSAKLKKAAQTFLNRYVYVLGCELSQMVRMSISARNWMRCGEPRSVRPAMKRIVEELAAIDSQIGMLYEDGPGGKDRSSESSRRTYYSYLSGHNVAGAAGARRGHFLSGVTGTPGPGRAGSGWGGASDLEHSFLTNLHKLFSDRIEVYSEVECNRAGIMTGVVKITLKTFFEYIRLQTFGKYGLQQIQVDAHYLQLYLWRFVSDENLLRMLLDEVVTSAYHRCVEPALMENSIVEAICHQAG